VQVIFSLATISLIYLIAKEITKNSRASLATAILLSFMTGMCQVSTFLTNELLNYFFIFLILYIFLRWKDEMDNVRYMLLGCISGLALINKITPVILIGIFGVLFVKRWWQNHEKRWPIYVVLFLLPIILLQIPWQQYRMEHIYETPTINNPHFLPPAPLKLDERIWFFTTFDFEIFKFPYWYSGGRGFWSMLYADSFYDYYGTLVNKNWLREASSDYLIRTTHAPTYMPATKARLTKFLPYLSLFPLLVLLLGFLRIISEALSSRKETALLALFTTVGFLSALIYFTYRYPFYDYGIVKSIFIYPIFLFPTIYGFNVLLGKKHLDYFKKYSTHFLIFGLIMYLTILIPTLIIAPYGY